MAAVTPRWTLLVAPALLVAAHLTFALPEVLAAEAVPVSTRSAPTYRLFNANVLVGNRDVAGYADEIRRSRPDILVLQESSPSFIAALEATGVLIDLPHRITVSRRDPSAALVAARWALSEDDVVAGWGRPVLVRATADLGGTQVRIFAFHSVAPVPGTREEWATDLSRSPGSTT